ncbi:MAG TPA: tRNA-dihydrouridine synthase family protein [Longilinea sp.]|nr:tRNA-dihydrouridine synthase family protein [Longilinea sp.]
MSALAIGNIQLKNDLILSPMDGYTDHPFRLIAAKLGSAVSYTEFINAIDVLQGHPHLEQRLFFSDEERPLVYQLLDNNVDRILQAAMILRQRNPDGFDLNLGCPAHKVASRGAGSGLLDTPEKIGQIIHTLTHNFDLPITAKIRLGPADDNENYLTVAKTIAENGASAIAVHARTRAQAFTGHAAWDAIAEIKQAVNIPVIGNGDINCVADIEAMKRHTGCDAVMIGRAAISNPWILSRRDRNTIGDDEFFAFVRHHLAQMMAFYGDRVGLILFRKFANRYIDYYRPDREIKTELLTSTTVDDFLAIFDHIIALSARRSP